MAGKDVNITVGAEDQATAILRKVEKSTSQLTKSVDRMGSVSQTAGKMFSFGFKSLVDVKAGLDMAASAIRGITSAIAGMGAAVDAFNTQEEAARGMTQAQLDFASALQVSTNLGDEATLALMRQAEMMGISKDQTDEVATAAAGLSEALGMNTTEALKKLSQAMAGNANSFAEFLPSIREVDAALAKGRNGFAKFIAAQQGIAEGQVIYQGVTQSIDDLSDAQLKLVAEQQKLAEISNVSGRGLSKLQEDAQSTRGVMERAAGAFGDLQEKIGALFEPIFRLTNLGFAVFAETLQTALGPAIAAVQGGFASMEPVINAIVTAFRQAAVVVGVAIQAIVSVIGAMASSVMSVFGAVGGATGSLSGFFTSMARGIIGAITMVEVVITNLPTIWDMAVTSIALRIEQMRADIEHVFTAVIPGYIQWFGENALNLLTDYFNLYVTVFSNFGQKLAGFFTTIFNFIRSGFEGGISGLVGDLGEAMAGSLTDGFVAATQPLPNIAARELTGAEQQLSGDLARMGMDLGNQFQTSFDERVKGLDFDVNGEFNLDMPDIGKIAGLKNQLNTAVQVQLQPLQAQEQRLVTRGVQDDQGQRIAENTRKTAEQIEELKRQMAEEERLTREALTQSREFSFVEVQR